MLMYFNDNSAQSKNTNGGQKDKLVDEWEGATKKLQKFSLYHKSDEPIANSNRLFSCDDIVIV